MRGSARTVRTLAVLVAAQLAAAALTGAAELPFERTEERAPCANYEPLRQPLFGETHLHTAYSFDAATLDTRNTPADAYRYAKGGKVGLPPWIDTRWQFDPEPPPPSEPPLVALSPYCLPPARCEFTASRIAQLPEGRALDWAAITDHAEQLGESNICLFNPVFPCDASDQCPLGQECGTTLAAGFCIPKGYTSPTCILARDELTRLDSGTAAAIIGIPENGNENPSRPAFCDATFFGDGLRCVQQAGDVWQQIQNDAEAAYDRTSACSFTSFIAYEYTAMMLAGRCQNATGLPCWDNLDTGLPSVDCPTTVPGANLCVGTYPGSGGFQNMHRNIIFRNDDVLDLPISNLEAPVGCGTGEGCDRPQPYPIGSPQQMLEELRARCKDRPADHPRCDVLSIPHNPNVSGGAMFLMPESLEEAKIRRDLEPLVELTQIKGASECRFLGAIPGAWGATDEECGFENYNYSQLTGSWIAPQDRTPENIPPNGFVRNTLKNGIAYQAEHGVNPFKLGFVGGLDNHNGTPGHSEEIDYARHGAHGNQSFATSSQILNEKYFLGLETNGGGLTVAWAEENSRDSIFSALARRETYATSGTRPVVRFFGGPDVPADMCSRGDFAARGYASGVPMGGTLGPNAKAPRFAVSALMDPGWPNHPGTKLDRVQIVKGWVDASGRAQEKVFELPASGGGLTPIGGDARILPDTGGPAVDLRTCRPTGIGRASLCGVWQDPEFDPEQHAFYYARVLEQPSCRWNQYYCNARGVDCSVPMGRCGSTDPAFNSRGCSDDAQCGGGVCETPLSYTKWEYQQCCSGLVPQTVQQRAWTSPIWYEPRAGTAS